jgi:competence protein ComEA
MNATPSPATDAGAAAPPPVLLAAWPRTAQWALGLLLTLAVVLIILHVTIGGLSDARPTQLGELRSPINLNTADRAMLRQLPEVGDTLATRIDEYRQRHGGFRSVDELVNVQGIGSTRLARLRQWLYVDDEEPGEEPTVKPASLPTKKQSSAGTPRASRKAEKLKGPVDINEATEDQLKDVPWLGPVLARSIVETRKTQPFLSVDDLLRVPGIKQKTLDKVKPFVIVGSKGSV